MPRRRPHTPVGAAIAAIGVAAAVLLGAGPAMADVDDFEFDSFHADLQLTRAADEHAEVTVVETIVALFPDEDQNRGIVRAIPDDYDDVPLHTEVLSVTDGDGEPVPYETERNGDFVEVATGDESYVRGEQTYVITYTQRDSIRAFDNTDSDEFFRDINGTGWEQPFGEVSATVTIDPALEGALTGHAACYVGGEGSTDPCPGVTEDAPGVFTASATDLGEGENLSIAIGFERGTFVPGEVVLTDAEQFAIDNAPVLQGGSIGAIVLALGAVAAAVVARRRGRDAAGRGIIVAQYDAPAGITVMQAAHLVGRGGAGIPAAIVDLAVAGHLRIVETEAAKFSLQFVEPSPRDAGRQRVLDALFGTSPAADEHVELDGDTTALAKRLAKLSADEHETLRTAGLTRKRTFRAIWLVLALVIVAFLVALGLLIFTAATGVATWVSSVALVAVLGIGFAAFAVIPYRDRITDAGATPRDHLIGLRDYLRLAETDRIRMLQSPAGAERRGPDDAEVLHLYERLLPYAIIWGVEKDWATVLETQATLAADDIGWYRGTTPFTSVHLIAALSATNTSTSATAQAWSSSGSGGFTGGSMGGGFSGGGAGGGGGGGR